VHANVARVLAGGNIPFRVLRHAEFPEPISSPADFARQLGYDLARITKTLLVRSTDGSRIDFHTLATIIAVKKVQVASPPELQMRTGYPRNGVSPLGVEGADVLLDDSLFQFETILIGSGETAVEIEIAPRDLLSLTGAVSQRIIL
jgi:Cys-tRNA(Pro)/Cys-tRNA(Cys) deacylase